MNEPRTFHCPTCGAPLIYKENAAVIECAYCKNTVIVPEPLRGLNINEQTLDSESEDVLGDIYLMVANNKKIEAIKRMRDKWELGLKEAKDIADAMERGEKIDPEIISVRIKTTTDNSSIEEKLLDLIDQGYKIQAIQQVRSATGLGLKESKEVIEALERGDNTALLDGINRAGNAKRTETSSVQISEKAIIRSGLFAGCGISLLHLSIFGAIILPIIFVMTLEGGPLAPLFHRINPLAFAKLELSFGTEGLGPGQFNDPRAITADRDGNIFVADYSSGRIQSFDSKGTFRWMVNLGNKVIIQSMDIANGDILYVAAQGTLHRLETATGKALPPYEPEGRYRFEDVAVAPDGRIALIYGGENVLVLNHELVPLFEIFNAVSSVTKKSELNGDIAIDSIGNIFILGAFNNKVLKYSPTGKYLSQFGGSTTEKARGKFRAVGDIAVDIYGRVYVSDIFGVQVFDNDGGYIAHFKMFQYAHGLNFDLNNKLYIADNNSQVIRLIIKE